MPFCMRFYFLRCVVCARIRLPTAFGVLTNGLSWRFFVVTKDDVLQYSADFQHEFGGMDTIVDILQAWIQGVIPDDMFEVLPAAVSVSRRSHKVAAQ